MIPNINHPSPPSQHILLDILILNSHIRMWFPKLLLFPPSSQPLPQQYYPQTPSTLRLDWPLFLITHLIQILQRNQKGIRRRLYSHVVQALLRLNSYPNNDTSTPLTKHNLQTHTDYPAILKS